MPSQNLKQKYFLLLLASLVIAGGLSLFASASPDGLEKVAEDRGFVSQAADYPLKVWAPDYVIEWIGNERLGTMLAGVLGIAVLSILIVVIYGIIGLRGKGLR
ncbi:MAG: PDGLE domain-containing protein [Parcubacteria group bacterium]